MRKDLYRVLRDCYKAETKLFVYWTDPTSNTGWSKGGTLDMMLIEDRGGKVTKLDKYEVTLTSQNIITPKDDDKPIGNSTTIPIGAITKIEEIVKTKEVWCRVPDKGNHKDKRE